VVFGAAFHYFFTSEGDDRKRTRLVRWIIGGVLFQVAVGILLYGSVPSRWDMMTNTTLIIGVVGAMILLWVVFSHQIRSAPLKGRQVVVLLMVVLIPMLLTRQIVQNRTLIPMTRKLQKEASLYAAKLNPHRKVALAAYREELNNPVEGGWRIYGRSCRFCHGARGDGHGKAASDLEIPAEHISAVRAERSYVYQALVDGIPGTAMPPFTYYTRDQLDQLLDFLSSEFNMSSRPERVPVPISNEALQRAEYQWGKICARCHGKDGRPTEMARGFQPRPPDFRFYGLSPRRAFHVITRGYPRTLMPPFGKLPKDVRWALVQLVTDKLKMDVVSKKAR
jgi:mono/diheme cytochrome c family protein